MEPRGASGPRTGDAITEFFSDSSRIEPFGTPLNRVRTMSAVVGQRSSEHSEQLELEALEKMVGALCEHVGGLVGDASRQEDFDSRESYFQAQAFNERRIQARQLLETECREPVWIRIERLEKLIEALECSRGYFAAAPTPAGPSDDDAPAWSVRVR
jgi:hypothetical protein